MGTLPMEIKVQIKQDEFQHSREPSLKKKVYKDD
jgi:hypothetical protein